jgi:hypothetical protein
MCNLVFIIAETKDVVDAKVRYYGQQGLSGDGRVGLGVGNDSTTPTDHLVRRGIQGYSTVAS